MIMTTTQMIKQRIDRIRPMIPVILPVFENWFSSRSLVAEPCKMRAMIAGIKPQPQYQQRMSDAIPHDMQAMDKPFDARGFCI